MSNRSSSASSQNLPLSPQSSSQALPPPLKGYWPTSGPMRPLGYPLENSALYLVGTQLKPSSFTAYRSLISWTLACALRDSTSIVRIHEAQEFPNTHGQFWRRSYTQLHEVHQNAKVRVLLKVASEEMFGWEEYQRLVNKALTEWNSRTRSGRVFAYDDPEGTRRDVVDLLHLCENPDRKLIYDYDDLIEMLYNYEHMALGGRGRYYNVHPVFKASSPWSRSSSASSIVSDTFSISEVSPSPTGETADSYLRVPWRHTLYLVASSLPPSPPQAHAGVSWSLAYPDKDHYLRCLRQLSSPLGGSSHAWSPYLPESRVRRVVRLSEQGRFLGDRGMRGPLSAALGPVPAMGEEELRRFGVELLPGTVGDVLRLVEILGGVTQYLGLVDLGRELAILDEEVRAEMCEEERVAAEREATSWAVQETAALKAPYQSISLETMFEVVH